MLDLTLLVESCLTRLMPGPDAKGDLRNHFLEMIVSIEYYSNGF